MQDIKTLTLISACERPRKRGLKGGGGWTEDVHENSIVLLVELSS